MIRIQCGWLLLNCILWWWNLSLRLRPRQNAPYECFPLYFFFFRQLAQFLSGFMATNELCAVGHPLVLVVGTGPGRVATARPPIVVFFFRKKADRIEMNSVLEPANRKPTILHGPRRPRGKKEQRLMVVGVEFWPIRRLASNVGNGQEEIFMAEWDEFWNVKRQFCR